MTSRILCKFSVIPDNAFYALIRNLDEFCEIPGSRFARPGMTTGMVARMTLAAAAPTP
jgi:hypothetical protein